MWVAITLSVKSYCNFLKVCMWPEVQPNACFQTDQFQCAHGKKCIDKDQVCDGVPQCQDRSDEQQCRKHPEDCAHHCDEKSHCLPANFICDGEKDCLDGTDEANCGMWLLFWSLTLGWAVFIFNSVCCMVFRGPRGSWNNCRTYTGPFRSVSSPQMWFGLPDVQRQVRLCPLQSCLWRRTRLQRWLRWGRLYLRMWNW